MKHFYLRILMLAVAALVLLPSAGMAQQEQGTGTGQTGASEPGSQQQGRMGRRARNRRHQQMLAKKLNLTDQQKQQFRQINQDFRKQAQAIHNDSSLSDADKKQKLQDLRKQSVQQRMGVLTPEQQQELKKMREEHRKDKGDKGEDKTSQNNKEEDDDLFAGMTSEDGGLSL